MNKAMILREIKRINPEWLMVIETAMLTHFNNLCPPHLGNAHKNPNASSIYFCFALALLMGEVEWWPQSFSKPFRAVCILYQAVVANVLTNIGMNFIYVPMTDGIKKLCHLAVRQMQDMNKPFLKRPIKILKRQQNVHIVSGLVCFALIFLAIYISERHQCIINFFQKIVNKVKGQQ